MDAETNARLTALENAVKTLGFNGTGFQSSGGCNIVRSGNNVIIDTSSLQSRINVLEAQILTLKGVTAPTPTERPLPAPPISGVQALISENGVIQWVTGEQFSC